MRKSVMDSTESRLPCNGQTRESVRAWAETLQVGDTVAIRESSTQIYFSYRLRRVEAITDEGRRVLVSDSEGTFWRTPNAAGQNCMHPKGQRHMIQPTAAVRKWIRTAVRTKETD